MEVMVALYAVHHTSFGGSIVDTIFLSPVLNTPGQNCVQKHLLGILYPDSRLVERLDSPVSINNALIIDRVSHRGTVTNKFLEPYLSVAPVWVEKMRQVVFKAIGVDRARPQRALYIHRNPVRTLATDVRLRLLDLISSYGFDVEIVDYAKLSWPEQVRITHKCSLLIGVHGNGLTNAIWMPDHGAVLEVFPEGMHHYDFQFLSELAGLHYLGIEGVVKNGFITRDLTRIGPATHGPSKTVTELPWNEIPKWLSLVVSQWQHSE
jgi:capsular polysaccharide biosynthesis protein